MIAVTPATGAIGSQLVKSLLARGEAVRVITADPRKRGPETSKRVDVVVGSSDDEAVFGRTLAGDEVPFRVVPPPHGTPDLSAHVLHEGQAPESAHMKAGALELDVFEEQRARGARLRVGATTDSGDRDNARDQGGLAVGDTVSSHLQIEATIPAT